MFKMNMGNAVFRLTVGGAELDMKEAEKKPAPHKHADLIKAWADGAEIQCLSSSGVWVDMPNPAWWVGTKYRVKPAPHVHADLIKAYEAGAKIEVLRSDGVWVECTYPTFWKPEIEYRVKREPSEAEKAMAARAAIQSTLKKLNAASDADALWVKKLNAASDADVLCVKPLFDAMVEALYGEGK